MTPPRRRQARTLRATLLVAGEGHGECALLSNVKSLYTRDNQGPRVQVVNARGGSATGAINTAIVRSRGFDVAAALFDTDTEDWNEKIRQQARRNHIVLLPTQPCLESFLLEIAGIRAVGNTQEMKNQFSDRFGGGAHEDQLIARHFTKPVLERARVNCELLENLLGLFEGK